MYTTTLDPVQRRTAEMDSVRLLGAPLKQFTSCVSAKSTSSNKKTVTKKTQPACRNGFGRRKSVGRRRSLPCSSQKVPDSWLRVYQDEINRERKRQKTLLAKKNAERAVRRTHFRSQHCLPRHTTPARRKPAVKDDAFFGAFQSLSLDGLMGASPSSPAAATAPINGEQCKVM